MPHARIWRRCLPAAALASVLFAAPAASQQVQLSVRQVQQLAVTALEQGDAGVAAQAANALLERDPSDAAALMMRTEAALLANDFEGAVEFGRRAYWNAATPNQRFSASRLVAFAHAQQENYTRSQVWLRLARQTAPNDEASAAVAKDYQFLRSRNPMSVNLRFGITPTTNVNNGSSSETTDLFDLGLPFRLNGNAQALSGWEIAGNADLRYRVHSNATSATFLNAGISARTYRLTENARDQAEDGVDGGDFSRATLSLGATHRFILAPDMQPTTATLSFAQSWSAGDPDARFVTASARQSWDLSERDTISLSGFAKKQLAYKGDDAVTTFSATTTWARDLENLGAFGLSVALTESQSVDTDSVFDSVKYGVSYGFPEPILGVQLSANVSYEDREYETSAFAPITGREEQTTSVSMRAVFTEIEFLGFRPVVNVEKVVRDASVALFERDYVNVGFDISSSF